ncbi:phage tail assembly protein [Salmonella enterica subsp. salamae]|nr:phage tail assembly protein [Salmonella enterica subsp. salamae]ECJ2281378.1 phage tail assembly protein [Salmonella enterica subsp. salamae]
MNFPADTVVITLSRPFAIDGKEVTEIIMREPTVRDRIMLNKGQGDAVEKELNMIAGLCGLTSTDLYSLPGYDYDQLTAAFERFLLPPDQRLTKR